MTPGRWVAVAPVARKCCKLCCNNFVAISAIHTDRSVASAGAESLRLCVAGCMIGMRCALQNLHLLRCLSTATGALALVDGRRGVADHAAANNRIDFRERRYTPAGRYASSCGCPHASCYLGLAFFSELTGDVWAIGGSANSIGSTASSCWTCMCPCGVLLFVVCLSAKACLQLQSACQAAA